MIACCLITRGGKSQSSPLLFIIKDPLAASQPFFRSVNNLHLSKSNCRSTARSSGSQFAERALRFHPLPHLGDVFTACTAIKMGHFFFLP